ASWWSKIRRVLIVLAVLIIPHVLIGIFLILHAMLMLVWLGAGDDHVGHVVRAWQQTNSKGITWHEIEYVYRDPSQRLAPEVHETTTVPREYFESLPPELKRKEAATTMELSPSPSVPITVRILHFGPLHHVAALPTASSRWTEAGGAVLAAAAWNTF